jgi:hypothetical protein
LSRAGQSKPSPMSPESARIAELERDTRELRRANVTAGSTDRRA